MGTPLFLGEATGRRFAMGLMVVSSVIISFGGLIIRNIEMADTWQINFYRAWALVAVVATIIAVQQRRRALQYVRSVAWPGLWGGVLLAVAGLAFLQSLTNTTVSNTLFTLCTIPFITAALARVFLGEHLRPVTLVTMVIAAGGAMVMVAQGLGTGSLYGNLMALVTALCFSGFAVIVRHNRHVDMLPTILLSGLIIIVVTFIVTFRDLHITWLDLVLCFVWGGILSGCANWMFIVASRYLVAAEVTLFMLLEFALGPLWVWLFVGETPAGWTLLGGAMIISAVAARAIVELGWTTKARAFSGDTGPRAPGP
ncbi:MAG: DMT family transporter [Pseudomonadota bacterium]